MLMTEKEAGKRWCPFGRQATRNPTGQSYVAANRNPDDDVPACLGAQCAAWRWYDPAIRELDLVTGELAGDVRRGYCGLAGPILQGDFNGIGGNAP